MIDLVYIYISNLSIHLSNLSRKTQHEWWNLSKGWVLPMIWQKDGGQHRRFHEFVLGWPYRISLRIDSSGKKRKTLQHLPSNIGSSCWTLLIYSWSIFQASWWHGQATWLSFPSSKMVTSPFSYIQPTRIPTVGGAPQLNIFHRLKHHQKRSPWGTEVCRCINPSKPFKPLFMVFA